MMQRAIVRRHSRTDAGALATGLSAIWSRLLCLIPAIILAPLAGCVAIQAPAGAFVDAGAASDDEDAIEPERELEWPERWGRSGRRVQGVIEPVEGPIDDLRGVRLGEHHQLRTPEEERGPVDRLAEGEEDVGLYRFRAEGPGSYIFVRRFEDPDHPRPAEQTQRLLSDPDEPAELFRYVSGREGRAVGGVPHVEIERTWFARYEPFAGEPRGLIVLLPGMFGTPEPVVESTVRYFRREGWGVLRMLSHPARFTQLVELEIAPGETGEWATLWGGVVSGMFQDNAAEIAFATEAGVLHAIEADAQLEDRPRVIVSMSGGAMMTPTVYARAPELYDAAVMIAGGSNILEIILESNYSSSIDSMRITWKGREPSLGEIEAWGEEYLRRAPFDPYHTAETMRGEPVLMLHAAKDKAVPAESGEQLWRRLGRPERWVYPVGHEMIFLFLPTQLDRISAWLDSALEGDAPGGDS